MEVVRTERGNTSKKEPTGTGDSIPEFGEERRSELLRDNRVSVAPRVCALDVGVVLVDGEVIRRNPRQSDISSKVR